MKITLTFGRLKTIQRCLIGFAILLILGAYGSVTQAAPEYHLVGLAAPSITNGQLVEVGQVVGIINATVKISSSEIFLDIGTGAIQGTIHWALEFDSSRCGKIIEDITYALTGTFDKTTKQFSATSTESRHYTIISPGDSTDFCKDVSFPSSDFVGVLEDDDKTISVYGCNGVGVACSFGDVGPGALRGRVSSDVPINLCSAGNAAQAVSEHRISTNDQPPPKCFEPPSITSVTAPAEWVLEKGTIVKVSFRNPGKRKILSVSLVGGVSGKGISQDVNVGGKEIGSFTIKEACGDLNHFVFGVIISNQDGDSNEASLNVNCILPKSDPPSVGAQPTLTKQQKDAFLKTAAAAEELAYGVAVLAVIGACPGLKEKAKSTCQDSLVALALRLFDYASEKRKLAADPPDPNYTEIAQPVTPPFTPITTQDPTLQKFVDAFNALLLNQAQTIGLDEALLHAMERAQGAYQAHDAFWQFQQLNAAAQFASQLATLLKAQTTLPSTIQKEWKNAGVPNISLTKDDVARLQNSINTQGFPKEILDALAKLNVNQATIDQLKQQLLAQPPQALAGTFPAKLNDPKLNSATQAVASGFTQMASKSCKVNVSADLSFVRFDEDVARYFAFLPDGKKDGHFQLTLTRPNSSNLIYLKLETANTNNRPAFSQG
ncbi:hypothetical protein HY009_10735, partial [Candidatus Acetothermia bacterium]|nr:hypothetical protein [Candidatus Acetothermia bacterium]